MPSQAYYDWIRAGKPYALIRPARAVQAALRRHGITVYDFPDEGHQKADPPEDHTPYSATGFPGTNARWNARGLDIMPRSDSYAHRKENADIARQMIRDRDAGVPGAMWIKYLNWTDEQGVCRQERWTDRANPLKRTTRSSSDKGHIHVSGRSDADNDTRADSYDPIARMRGNLAAEGGSTMPGYTAPNPNAGENVEEILAAILKLTPVKVGALPAGNVKGMAGEAYPAPNNLATKLDQIAAAVTAGGQVTPTEGQWTALTTAITTAVTTTVEELFATKVGAAAELAAEAAIRRVLGGLDGAVPPPPATQ